MLLQTWQNIKSCVNPHEVAFFTFKSRVRTSSRLVSYSSHDFYIQLASSHIKSAHFTFKLSYFTFKFDVKWNLTSYSSSRRDTIQDGINIIQERRRHFVINRHSERLETTTATRSNTWRLLTWVVPWTFRRVLVRVACSCRHKKITLVAAQNIHPCDCWLSRVQINFLLNRVQYLRVSLEQGT